MFVTRATHGFDRIQDAMQMALRHRKDRRLVRDLQRVNATIRTYVRELDHDVMALRREVDELRRDVARRDELTVSAERQAAADLVARYTAHRDEVAFDPTGAFIYILWGVDRQRPLYVGQSTNVLARLGKHLSDRRWRGEIVRVAILPCPEGSMWVIERELIATLRPLWNVLHQTSELTA